eukprot:811799-Amphidinium_carterae.1
MLRCAISLESKSWACMLDGLRSDHLFSFPALLARTCGRRVTTIDLLKLGAWPLHILHTLRCKIRTKAEKLQAGAVSIALACALYVNRSLMRCVMQGAM